MFEGISNDGSLKFHFERVPVNQLNLPVLSVKKGRNIYKKYVVYLPTNLDINELIGNELPFEKFNIDHCHYILGVITELQAVSTSFYNAPNPFVPMSSWLLKEVGIRHYRKYLDWLVENSILEEDDDYSRLRNKCKSFRFIDRFINTQKTVAIEWNQLNRSIWILRERLKLLDVVPKHLAVKVHIDGFLKHLRIDGGMAKRIRETRLNLDLLNTRREEKQKGYGRYKSAERSTDKILNGDWFSKVDSTSFRYHSNLSNISRDLRHAIKYGDETLYEIDIRCSQPYFLLTLLPPPTNPPPGSNSISIMWANSYQEEYSGYKELVTTGKLYDHVLEEAKRLCVIQEDLDSKAARDYVKYGILEWFYSYGFKKTLRASNIEPVFRALFPLVSKEIDELNRRHGKRFPILLQQAESDFVLGSIIGKTMVERPDVPTLPIHDSIATTESNVEYVRSLIKAEAKAQMGAAPDLRVTEWNHPERIVRRHTRDYFKTWRSLNHPRPELAYKRKAK